MSRDERRLRDESEWVRAKHDSGAMSDAMFAVVKSIETEIAWAQHRDRAQAGDATMSKIFCAEFSDGVATRMTTWHAKDRKTLDLKRGVRLARYAYETHVHNRERRIGFGGPPVTVPPIVSAHFEDERGAILEKYTAERVAAS